MRVREWQTPHDSNEGVMLGEVIHSCYDKSHGEGQTQSVVGGEGNIPLQNFLQNELSIPHVVPAQRRKLVVFEVGSGRTSLRSHDAELVIVTIPLMF